jgi:MFS family permease
MDPSRAESADARGTRPDPASPPDEPGILTAIGHSIAGNFRRLRRWNARDGAGESGLALLIETHALQTAGDATVAVALAGTLFFSVPTHEARSRVALYLLITMLPFAVIAPLLGPLLDRFRRGRRTALAFTLIARAVLALVVAHALTHRDTPAVAQALTLYPAALGVLVASKAYGVARSAAVPRLVPEGMTLVQANSRLSIASIVATGVAGVIAVFVAQTLGHRPELLLGAAVYLLAAATTLRLPAAADGSTGPTPEPDPLSTGGLVLPSKVTIEIRHALRSAAALRWLSGFMLLFGAFLVRVHPLGGLSANACLGALALAIGAGNFLGNALGPRFAAATANRLAAVLLGATTAACIVTVFDLGLITVLVLAVVGSAAAATSKLALDATIQRQTRDEIRTSVFARSETTLQLAWVLGGAVGILLPTNATIGFAVAGGVLAFAFAMAIGYRPTLWNRANRT